jgi:hypothetical protein
MVQDSFSGAIMKKIPFSAVAMPDSNTDMASAYVLIQQDLDASLRRFPGRPTAEISVRDRD